MNDGHPLRFCMVSTFYPPYHFGGDAVYIHRLAHALAARGHHVEVVHCKDAYHLLHPGEPEHRMMPDSTVTVHSLKSRWGALSPWITQQAGTPGLKAPALRRILDNGRFDVIHFHNISLVGGPRVLAMGSAVKLYTLHEYWLVCPTHILFKNGREACERPSCLRCTLLHGRPPQLWRYTGLARQMARHVDAFLSPSRFAAGKHRAMGLGGRFDILPMFAPEPPAAATPADLAPAEPYFLFVGRLEKLKGLHTVLRLFRDDAPAGLVVAGTGSREVEWKALAGPGSRVRFLGAQPASQLAALYRGAIATLVPSLCFETFGQVVAESFAAGTPVIARDIGALTEIVNDSGGGALFRTEGELLGLLRELAGNRARRDELGRAGRAAYLARFSEKRHVDAYLDIARSILRAKGAAA